MSFPVSCHRHRTQHRNLAQCPEAEAEAAEVLSQVAQPESGKYLCRGYQWRSSLVSGL